MRPTLAAVVIALVLLTAAFVVLVPGQDRSLSPASAPSGLRAEATPTYAVSLDVATEPILPGYQDILYYYALNDTNKAPVTGLSSVVITGTYYNNAHTLLKLPGTPYTAPTSAIGNWTFVVPANTSADFDYEPSLTVYANSSSLAMNVSSTFDLEVGTLHIFDLSVCDVITGCGALTTGNPATVSLYAYAEDEFGDTSPVANESVKVLFYSTGSSPVTVPGVPTTLKTNAVGYAALTFTPSSTIFNVPGPNHIEVEVTDAVNTSLTVYENHTWDLYNPAGTTYYTFTLNQATYYSGETVTASWQFAGTNSTVGTITVALYVAYADATGNILSTGSIDSTAAAGSFSFALPSGWYGELTVEILAHNATTYWAPEASAEVDQALFAVVPSEFYFNPGDTVVANITAEGPAVAGATISAFVQATDSGQTLFNGTVTGLSFSFKIPTVAPADEYRIVAWASTSAGTVAQDAEDIYEAAGYNLWAGVTTVSSYSDGSFSPGQVVQIGYKLTAYGGDSLPRALELYIFPGTCSYLSCATDTPSLKIWAETSASGSVSFTIPANTANGLQFYTVYAEFSTGTAAGSVTVNVNSSPSVLNYELGAGSGLTVGWLILLILLIIVAIALFLLGRRSKPTMVMSPSASTPAASPPEWKEGGSSGGNAPSGSGGSSSGSGGSTPPGAQ